ncbi:hypothetical protein FMUND_7644 [Fusarium mundagurra]|uniref:Uncharacterized protein n=1 Tax=Fusarium mundagurra TaxID=1567541 RepID=A0A8H5YKF2_9HYPO|nr:hypothetical protein FMUND_7644 [Fusarium mundagurra]
MAKKKKPTLRERRALRAQAAPAFAPSTAEIDMSNTETHAKQERAAAEKMPRQKAEIKQRLEQHDDAIDEMGKLIAQAGNKAFEMEQAVEKLENEHDFEEPECYTFDDLDRYKIRGWGLLENTKRELRSLVDENYKLKIQIHTHKSIFTQQTFVQKQQKAALDQQKAAIEQLRPTIGAMRDRLYEVEIVANKILGKATEKDLQS